MKKKLLCEIVILSSIIIFMTFIIYVAFFFPNVKSQLISNNYYEEEIKYQKIIDEKKNALKISKKINIFATNSGIVIRFPFSNGKGFVTLFRFSSKNLDFTKYFNLCKMSDKKLFIPKKFLVKGYYKIIIRWNDGNKKRYFIEKELFWNY
ncbi:FixH family protein [Blattabacterium cuenoti]|uniref:FixH family protein n=1 Tax=Blattabacterium cuenoti TaxID=1653831 RepID=UPI00163BB724|nr:FixH family protein [Blattabacterium cuenoti]